MMKPSEFDLVEQEYPLLNCKTEEDIAAYRSKPVALRLQWLEAQMEFFHTVMPERAKKIRELFRRGEI